MTAARIRALVKAEPGPIEVVNARELTAFPAGAVVFDCVAEIHADAITTLPQAQAKIDIGLALPELEIEAANGAEHFHVHEGAARVHSVDRGDALAGKRFRWA